MELETETDIFHVRTNVSNLAINLESTNTVLIRLQEVIIDEGSEDGVTYLTPYHICLKPRGGFTPSHLSQLLDEQEVRHSQDLGETIHRQINESFANDHSLQEPVYVTVGVSLIENRRLNANVPPPSKGTSWEVIQRLVKEQKVELMDLKETNEIQCSICIKDLTINHEHIIQMPQCKHMFHQDCLFQWLGQQNSCPLCRSVPYGE